jgi:protoporphyrinogen oxidase
MAIVSVGARLRRFERAAGGWRAYVWSTPAILLPLLALLVLVAVFFPEREDDEAGYLELARNLLDGHYATGRPDALLDADPAYPDLWFGPGLPLALVGPVAADLPLALVRLLGPAFLFLALLVFFHLARRSLSTKVAALATWSLGLYLPFYTVLPNLHSEPLAVLFVVLALYATARRSEETSTRWLVFGAVALAGLALTRVDYGWVLAVVFLVLLGWWALSRHAAARRLAAMYAAALVLCVPWLAYTTAETGRVWQWGNSGSLSLYWMSSPYPGDLGDWQQAHLVFSDPNLAAHRPFFEGLRGLTLAEQNAELERRALVNIRDHPVKYLENVAANVSRMLFDTPYSYSRQRLSALYFALPNALLMGAMVLAALVAVRAHGSLPAPAAPFAIFAAVAFGLHALVSAYPRMLMPIVPALVWLAATTIVSNLRLVEPRLGAAAEVADRGRGSPVSPTERQDVIVGAGLAGLSAAYTLLELGESEWQVYERETRVGGHARSIEIDGYVFDFGPHILFSADPEIGALIRDLLGSNFTAQSREAYIYHHAYGLYTRFPFQAHLHGLPVSVVLECLSGLVAAVERRARGGFNPGNYEEWMRGTFGDGITERLMIPYARKVWTVEPSEMDFAWIERRVPTPDVERIIAGALSDDVDLVGVTAQFWYPERGGIEALPRALGERVTNVNLEREVERIEFATRTLVFRDGEHVAFDRLIYTLPLSALASLAPDLPPRVRDACHGLRYQGICCVSLGIDRPDLSDKHWVYFYEDGFPFHRLSFPGNFTPHNVPPGKSSISMEIAFSDTLPLDREHVVEQAIEALGRAGILSPDDRIELVHVQEIAPAYVIYDLHHAENVATIHSWLRENRVLPAGRFGEWQYFNMDQAMRSGREAAQEMARRPRGVRRRRSAELVRRG